MAAISHIKSNTVADFTGTVTVLNSQGSTVTANATDLVRPSDWNSAHNFFQTISGNTAGSSTASGTNIVFQGGNNITLSMNTAASAATVVISGANQTVQPVAISGSNGSFNFSTVSFGNSNGVSFFSSNGSMVASHNGLTTARASNDAVGLNTALTAGPLAWTVNSSGISLNAGSAAGTTSGFAGNSISGSMTFNTAGLNLSLNHPAWLTTAAQSNHSHGNPQLNLTNLSGTTASNSAGFTLSLSAAAPGGGGGAAISAGANSQNTGTVNFANSNGITFGLSNNGTMTASYNSTQFAGQGTTFAGANISASMTLNSNGLNLSASVAAPGAAAEQNAFNLLGANTSGNTTATGSTIGLSGVNMTLSGTNNSQIVMSVPATSSLSAVAPITVQTNGSTISIGLNQALQSFFRAFPENGSTQAAQIGNGTIAVLPVIREGALSVSRADILASISLSSSSNSSHAGVISAYIGIYTRNGSTLSLASSGSQSHQWSNTSNNSVASVASLRQLSVPLNINYTDGQDLWVAVMTRTSTTNANWFTASNILQPQAGHTAQVVGLIGQASNNTQGILGLGRYSASSTALPSSMAFSHITGGATASISRFAPNVYFANFTA